jgi:uncharacterized YkwD family protein
MKKWLLGLTMGIMVFSLGQATTAEASFSSNAPTCNINDSWSAARSQQYPVSKILDGKSLNEFEKLFAKYMAIAGQKPVAEKPAAEKPVEQKPVTEKPVQKPVEQKPVAPAPATPAPAEKPVEQKPATPSQPVQEKPATPATSISAIEQQVLTLTNQERAKGGLKPLATDAPLMASARAKSTDMRSNNYFDHNSPTLGSPFDQMKARGINYRSAAENIAMGQRTPEEVVKGWMNSPGHRANIMNGNYTHIGIGYDAQGHYWTQQFIQK